MLHNCSEIYTALFKQWLWHLIDKIWYSLLPPSLPLSLSLSVPQTGTLTQNVMTFLKCTIGGVKYGDHTQDSKDKEQVVSTGEETLKASQGGNTSPVSKLTLSNAIVT